MQFVKGIGGKTVPIVGSAPEDVVGAAQLLQVCQALELRRVYDLYAGRAQPEMVVDGVVEEL